MNRDFIEYAGFILIVGLSLVLSVMLFTSVADNRFSWLLLMGIAVALEIGKLLSIHDQSRLLACLLIAVSVFGSAGGLSRAMAVSEQQFSVIDDQRQSLLTEIQQNNQAIDRYLALDRIKADAQPLQQRNALLRQQLKALPEATMSELGSLIRLLSDFLALPLDWVRALVILLLACLLDALMIRCVRSGLLDRCTSPGDDPDGTLMDDTTKTNRVVEPEPETVIHKNSIANVEALADSYPAFRRMMLKRKAEGQGVLSQRACIRDLGIRERLVRQYFKKLAQEGVVEKVRQQYHWCSQSGPFRVCL